MNYERWLYDYFDLYKKSIFNEKIYERLVELKNTFVQTSRNGKKLIFAGNGGSASIAEHCAVDLTKNARVRAVDFSSSAMITCFANDYGYTEWVAKAIEFYGDKGDVAVLISSSGNSENIINAAKKAKKIGMIVITFSGFSPDNELRKLGDINFWVNSRAYNVVETTHQVWLLSVIDMIIGKAEYSAS